MYRAITFFFILGFCFSVIVSKQTTKVNTQLLDFERRLEVSKQYDLTIERMKGEK